MNCFSYKNLFHQERSAPILIISVDLTHSDNLVYSKVENNSLGIDFSNSVNPI